MKKTSLILFGLLLLSSCQKGNQNDSSSSPSYSFADEKDCIVDTLVSGYTGIASGDIRVVAPKDDPLLVSVAPFNTTILGYLYSVKNTWSDSDLTIFQKDFSNQLSFYSALCDRHYDYTQVTKRNEEGKAKTIVPLNNLKTINDSYGTGKWITVDPFLYDVLKENYDFTLYSEGKFNMFVGEVSSLYETYIPKAKAMPNSLSSLNYAWNLSNDLYFGDDIPEETLKKTVDDLPKSKEDLESLLSFDEAKHAVRFNSLGNEGKISITLGGSAKGFATDKIASYFQDLYPDICLLMDSGSSSIRATSYRPDGSDWRVSYTNPIYEEKVHKNANLNRRETYFSHFGPFSLSTSSYYEQYFYVYDKENKAFQRRDHIVNPQTGYSTSFLDQTSVLLPSAGRADMFTTALMNTDSVEEAKASFEEWKKHYGYQEGEMILTYKAKDKEGKIPYAYEPSELSNLSSYQLPTVKKKDGSTYTGDYTDLSSSDIDSSLSFPTRSFYEIYAYTEGLENTFFDFTEVTSSFFTHPENKLAVLRKL